MEEIDESSNGADGYSAETSGAIDATTEGMKYLAAQAVEHGLVVVRRSTPGYDQSISLLENFGYYVQGRYVLSSTDILRSEMFLAPEQPEYDLHKITDMLEGFKSDVVLARDGLRPSDTTPARYEKRGKLLYPADLAVREDGGAHEVTDAINIGLELDIPAGDSHTNSTSLSAVTNLHLFPNSRLANSAYLSTANFAVAGLRNRKFKLVREALAHNQAFHDLVPQLG